ncbi:transcriptional repressor [Mycobacterium phage DyoEdafos]|uniref:Cro protein n=1 Tax=Mycobacterium phage DyoEdafos TaxID=2599860 RepID=A0A5J6TH79_9CAUD|nr:transcriptional repressor [Mycobacterium phage DyoEdafos]QFG10271.1 Cro protein [Mycobacterium phage DyoEdafos]
MPITTASQPSYKIEWIPEAVENLLHNHDILNRNELAKELKVSRSRVYETFSENWSGRASMRVLEAMCGHFRVPISRIVTEPGRASAQARARRQTVRKTV